MSIDVPEERPAQCVKCGEFKTDCNPLDMCRACQEYEEAEQRIKKEKSDLKKREALMTESASLKAKREEARQRELDEVVDHRPAPGLRERIRARRAGRGNDDTGND